MKEKERMNTKNNSDICLNCGALGKDDSSVTLRAMDGSMHYRCTECPFRWIYSTISHCIRPPVCSTVKDAANFQRILDSTYARGDLTRA